MEMPVLKAGDIFFTDNYSVASKIVKFLMVAPTIWQYIWRAIRKTQNEVRFYHAGLILSQDEMIEQQSDVRFGNTEKIFRKEYVIWRNKKLSNLESHMITEIAKLDLGKKYDILLCVGKLFTWLTGIKIFTRVIQQREKEICVTRVAKWYQLATGINFNCKTWHEVTTDIIDDYCCAHPEEWEQIAVSQKYVTERILGVS